MLVINALGVGEADQATLRLANQLARDLRVYLCNAHPAVHEPGSLDWLDPSVILIEGTLRGTVWSGVDDGTTAEFALSSRRCRVIRELIQFYQVELIYAQPGPADRLARAVNEGLGLPLQDPGHRAVVPRDRWPADRSHDCRTRFPGMGLAPDLVKRRNPEELLGV